MAKETSQEEKCIEKRAKERRFFFAQTHIKTRTTTTSSQTMQRTRRTNKSDAAVDARLGRTVNWLKEFMMMAAILVVCFLAYFYTTPQASKRTHTHLFQR